MVDVREFKNSYTVCEALLQFKLRSLTRPTRRLRRHCGSSAPSEPRGRAPGGRLVCVCPWSQGHRNGLTGVLTGVAESASLLPAGRGCSWEGPALVPGRVPSSGNQTSGPMGEMLLCGYCAAVSKIFKTKEDT